MTHQTTEATPEWPNAWPEDSFRPGPTALLILAIIGVSVLVLFGAAVWFYVLHPAEARRGAISIVPAMIVQLVLEALIVLILVQALPRVSKLSLRELGFVPLRGSQVGIAIAAAIVMAIVVNGGATLVETLTHQRHEQQVVEMFKAVKNPGAIAFFAIFAVMLAPIAEEMVFRVFFFNLGLRYGGFWLGSTISAVLFGLAHGDIYVLVPLALGGLVLCSVYYYTRNAFASMITHGLFNSLTVFTLIFAPNLAK